MSIHWKRFGTVEERERIYDKLDVAGGDVWILERFFAFADATRGGKDVFVADRLSKGESLSVLWGDDELDKTGVITEIDKNQATMVTTGIYPTLDGYRFC